MKKLLKAFGILGSDDSVQIISVVVYFALAKYMNCETTFVDAIFIVAALSAYSFDRFFISVKNPTKENNLDLSALRSDIDKLKIALQFKEMKR